MTKKWNEHKATIISFYKEQHRPLREVQRLMAEQYGFMASVRAYRSRFDRWGVHKYNCRRKAGSGSEGSQGGSPRAEDSQYIKAEEHEPPLAGATMTPPSSPQAGAPLAGEQGHGQQLALQRVPSMPLHQRFFVDSAGAGGADYVPPSPGPSVGTESTSSGALSRTSSISQPVNTDPSSLAYHRHSRSDLEYSTSPTDQQYSPYGVYQQHTYQQYQGPPRYQPYPNRALSATNLASPAGMATHYDQGGSAFTWSASSLQAPYQIPGADIKGPRE